MSSYRISKVLSELNIGLDTAVDYLKSKDFDRYAALIAKLGLRK